MNAVRCADAILGLLIVFSAHAADVASYAGARACRTCHKEQFEQQSATGHARTLHRADGHPQAARFAGLPPVSRPPRFLFTLQHDDAGLRFKLREGSSELELPVDWAFGSGTHGVTFVSRLGEGAYLEHALTFYSEERALDLTPGHRSMAAQTLMEAAGQPLSGSTARSCFGCHSTGPVSLSSKRFTEVSEAGVRCEACHGAGKIHSEAATRGDTKAARQAIRSLRTLSSDNLSRLCGQCHRPPSGAEASNDFTNPWNVRHQPPYLEQSRCFQASRGALSCITCHDPHQPLRRKYPDYYRQTCIGCHTGRTAALKPAVECAADSLPDCTRCHMPPVVADQRLTFRNHWIGVYRPGRPLIPGR